MMENNTIKFLEALEALTKEHGFRVDIFSFERLPRDERGALLKPELNINLVYEGDK